MTVRLLESRGAACLRNDPGSIKPHMHAYARSPASPSRQAVRLSSCRQPQLQAHAVWTESGAQQSVRVVHPFNT